jgi:hypothetical protein
VSDTSLSPRRGGRSRESAAARRDCGGHGASRSGEENAAQRAHSGEQAGRQTAGEETEGDEDDVAEEEDDDDEVDDEDVADADAQGEGAASRAEALLAARFCNVARVICDIE